MAYLDEELKNLEPFSTTKPNFNNQDLEQLQSQ